jgi:hypothetical protein
LGFRGVMSGPLVRSSYRAGRLYREALAERSDEHRREALAERSDEHRREALAARDEGHPQ